MNLSKGLESKSRVMYTLKKQSLPGIPNPCLTEPESQKQTKTNIPPKNKQQKKMGNMCNQTLTQDQRHNESKVFPAAPGDFTEALDCNTPQLCLSSCRGNTEGNPSVQMHARVSYAMNLGGGGRARLCFTIDSNFSTLPELQSRGIAGRLRGEGCLLPTLTA